MKKVLVAGTFDILHPGHLNFLKQAKKRGDFLVVVIARDKTVKKIKGKKPKNNERLRLANLKKEKVANQVILGHKNDKLKLIEKIKLDIICLGYDQKISIKKLKADLKKRDLSPRLIRLKSFHPRRYKSSLMKPNS